MIKDIIDAERWIGNHDSTYQHADGHTTEVLYSAHNYSIDRLEQAVVDCVSELEAKMEAYRQANDSKAARIEKMKAQWEEDAQSWKQRIAELEKQVPKVVKPVYNLGNYDCPDCEYRTLSESYLYCPNCGAKLNWEEA